MTMISPSYSIRLTAGEKASLKELARRLKKSQANTIRFLVRESLDALKKRDVIKPKSTRTSRTKAQDVLRQC